MRDALSITDQAIGFGQGQLTLDGVVDMLGLVGRDEVGSLIEALASGAAARVLAVVGELADRAVDFETLLADVLAALHEMAVSHALGEGESLLFDAQTVQLLYQIGLMGFRDLQIAPDPRSGVEMTLLRMLTFSPDEPGRAVPRIAADTAPPAEGASGTEASPKETPPSEQAVSTTKTSPTAKTPPTEVVATPGEPSTPRPRRATGSTPWHELVAALELGGVARMIAEHSGLVELGEDHVSLVLDRAHDTLLGEAQSAAIERALCDFLDRPVVLSIEPGEVADETPAARRVRIAEQRQQEAEHLLQADAGVQSLLSEFDGRIDDVQAVDVPPPAQAEDSQQSGGAGR